ncbi:MAG: FKBP-type peptidyl-prolyl cis-trans isomerase [Mycoplasmatales bacterium]|nr:FKBP-type peptidyl-prolyl cis-trans isomerase [Mycoplasmatales bacterium]
MSLQRDNRALIKFEGRIGGNSYETSTAFPGGTSTRVYPLIIGSNSFIGAGKDFTTGKNYKGFEEQLIGMEKGEIRIIEVIFPQNYHAEEFAGKVAFFKVELDDFS